MVIVSTSSNIRIKMKQTIYILTFIVGLLSCNNQPKKVDQTIVSPIASNTQQEIPKFIIFYKPYADNNDLDIYLPKLIKFDYKTQYENIKNANIEKDLETAVHNNDYKVVSISGYSYLFPGLEGGYQTTNDGTKIFIGLDPKYENYIKIYGFKVIKGTSDAIADTLPMQSVAYKYAKKYNLLLLEKMKMEKNY